MSTLAASGLGGFGWLLFALACPLMMIFMMRGMHGGHGHGHAGHGAPAEPAETPRPRETMSIDELKRERDELNALIGERAEEAVEAER
jgi:hypothetical protein